MFVSGGALLVIYAAGALKDKEEFRATIALIWLTIGCYITGIQFQAGHFNSHVWFLLIAGIIPVFAGTWIGTKLVKKLPQEIFYENDIHFITAVRSHGDCINKGGQDMSVVLKEAIRQAGCADIKLVAGKTV